MPVNWGPVIGGGVALGSTLLAGRQRPEEQQAVQSGRNILGLSQGLAQNMIPQGQGMIRQGIGTMQPSLDYWRGLLSGGQATTAAASPDIQRINQQYQALRQGQAELAPRGGGRAALLSELPYQQMRDVSNTITQQRAAAAPALAQAGGQIAQTGSSSINNAISALYATSTAGQNLLNYAQQRRDTDIAQGKGIGAGIVDIMKGVAHKLFGVGGTEAGGAGGVFGSGMGAGGAMSLSGGAPDLMASDAGVTGGGGGGILGGGSHLLHLAAMHPFAAAAIGAGLGGALLAHHFVGQGRRAADVLTGEGGMQRSFENTLRSIDAMNIPDDQKWQHKREAYDGLVRMGLEHAKKGDNERKVVKQMFQTVSPLFGQPNPLA